MASDDHNSETDLRELIRKAHERFDAMPEAKRVHARHKQRISWVYGDLAIDMPDATPLELIRLRTRVAIAAGPCPCADCGAHRAS